MPASKIDFETVRKIALALPDVADGPDSLKTRGKLLAWIPRHRSAEPKSLAVSISIDDRTDLLTASPDVYYVPTHYQNYPTVLVRLSRIHPDALKDLLAMAWRFVTSKSPRKKLNAPRPSAAHSNS